MGKSRGWNPIETAGSSCCLCHQNSANADGWSQLLISLDGELPRKEVKLNSGYVWHLTEDKYMKYLYAIEKERILFFWGVKYMGGNKSSVSTKLIKTCPRAIKGLSTFLLTSLGALVWTCSTHMCRCFSEAQDSSRNLTECTFIRAEIRESQKKKINDSNL